VVNAVFGPLSHHFMPVIIDTLASRSLSSKRRLFNYTYRIAAACASAKSVSVGVMLNRIPGANLTGVTGSNITTVGYERVTYTAGGTAGDSILANHTAEAGLT
jgi:hypothetical protein